MESYCSSSRKSTAQLNVEKFIKNVIIPAIRSKTCSICLRIMEEKSSALLAVCKHAYCVQCIRKWSRLKRVCPLCNAHFDSWFADINLSSWSFRKERLPPLDGDLDLDFQFRSSSSRVDAVHRIVRNARNECSEIRSRTRSVPWRRSFGRPGLVHADVIAQRKLEWRTSVYSRRLQAIPLSPKNNTELSVLMKNDCFIEKTKRRIEPWIRRELRAILGDPNPSIIVHLATTQFIAGLEEKMNVARGQCHEEDFFLAPLVPFLHNKTKLFWHELRVFTDNRNLRLGYRL